MKTVKQVLRPERLRQAPSQFSWVDQGLVQHQLIDRCDARAAALYLFLITVCDSQGMSYYGASTLCQRLHLSATQLDTARQQLIGLELIAYQAPLYQVLALPASRHQAPALPSVGAPTRQTQSVPPSLAQRLESLRRHHA